MLIDCDSQAVVWTNPLAAAGLRYLRSGCSIIPVYGAADPARAKHPPIRWADFQRTPPTRDDLRRWFIEQGWGGLAVVCGRISNLFVLDFDDPHEASEFRRLLPNLADTYTVRSGTRGLPHLYFRPPPGSRVATQAFRGVDLRGEGSYVLAPPTQAGDSAWMVDHDVPIRALSAADYAELLAWLAGRRAPGVEDRVTGSVGIPTPDVGRGMIYHAPASPCTPPAVSLDLQAVYRRALPQGRNNALFQAARAARDHGWSQTAVADLLVTLHAVEQARRGENIRQRWREGLRTIASAYSRPPRLLRDPAARKGLPNALRERLLADGQAAAARVWDGLLMAGVVPGTLLTERGIVERLAGQGIGRRSVMTALAALLGDGSPLFDRAGAGIPTPQPPCTPRNTANAAPDGWADENSCEMSRGAKRVKTGGRPPRSVILPSPQAVAARLGLVIRGGDALVPAALASPRAYREALHAAFIARAPGQYVRAWLGARLGVSRWTTRRYEARLGLQVQPEYSQQPLTWATLDSLVPADPDCLPRGVFLVDARGKRYPANRGAAQRLLARGARLLVCRQLPNRYAPRSVGIPTPARLRMRHEAAAPGAWPAPHAPAGARHGVFAPGAWPAAHTPAGAARRVAAGTPHAAAAADHGLRSVGIPTPERGQPLPHHAASGVPPQHPAASTPHPASLAAWVRDRVARLSLRSAAQLITRYGEEAVRRAVGQVLARAGLRNPAGFLVMLLRSEQKSASRSQSSRKLQPPASASDWLRAESQSPYLDFLVNADDVRQAAAALAGIAQ